MNNTRLLDEIPIKLPSEKLEANWTLEPPTVLSPFPPIFDPSAVESLKREINKFNMLEEDMGDEGDSKKEPINETNMSWDGGEIDSDDEEEDYDIVEEEDAAPSENGYEPSNENRMIPLVEISAKKTISAAKIAKKMKTLNGEDELQKGSHDHLIRSISTGTKILFESDSFICFLIETYSIQKFLNKNTVSRLKQVEKKLYDFDLGNDVKETIFISGIFNFIYKDAICSFVTDADSLHTSITVSNKKIAAELEKEINEYIRNNNPIKNKLIYLIQARSGIAFEIKQTPKETFDSIILDEKIKEDIIDNTLGNLQLVDDNNGLIFYGDPGTGKSVSCRAVINLVLEHGYSCCYITTDFDFNSLNTFIQKYLAPCVIIFEDVDTIGKSRERVDNPNLANFLQFLSGLTDTSDQVVFIATTNHIDKLDKALSNRPVRFNRLIGFDFPNNDQINELVELKFAGDGITPELKKLCHNLKWTGAHIHELRRTCKLYSKKRDKTIAEVFAESVDIVKQSFSMHIKPNIGFNPKLN